MIKKIISSLLAFVLSSAISNAQPSTAMDYNMSDCATGNMHHLFETLDSNEVVIMGIFMTCTSCINAGHKIENMLVGLNNLYPGKINWQMFGYTNSYDCTTVNDFVSINGFTCVPFDSGQNMVAHYGGFGMPTVAVVAGVNHDVLFTDVGFVTSDTTAIANAIHNYFNALNGIPKVNEVNALNIFPNPSNDVVNIQLYLNQNATVQLQLFDLSGKEVAELFNGEVNAGMLNKTISVTDYAEGIYLMKAIVNGKSVYNKISVTK